MALQNYVDKGKAGSHILMMVVLLACLGTQAHMEKRKTECGDCCF